MRLWLAALALLALPVRAEDVEVRTTGGGQARAFAIEGPNSATAGAAARAVPGGTGAAASATASATARAGGEPGQRASVSATPFPTEIRARFRLTDQTGRAVTEADFAGRPMAVFFGYATCEAICSVALPRLGQALDLLGPKAAALTPILITVDPARDTPAAMGPALARWHPRLIGLTGSAAALAKARAAFQVEATEVFEGPEGPVYAHGSFIYLIGPDGRVLTLLPPILGPERMAEVIAGYL